ncbi:MAG: transcription antitermination factor NusB [Chlamydiae bacterium]|nr:transcription antitermination factor NusB [Chlamydiota bacterium]
MAISQQKRREILFQLLFSFDFTRVEDDDLNEFIMKEFFVSRSSVREMLDEIKQIAIHLTDLDAKITTYSIAYELHRIPKVELNILRLAIYEMLHIPSLPPKVSIAEAIRLTRKYATMESASFINAVLDAIFQSEIKETVVEGSINELPIPVLAE